MLSVEVPRDCCGTHSRNASADRHLRFIDGSRSALLGLVKPPASGKLAVCSTLLHSAV